MPEQDPEHEYVCRGAGLGRVPVLPRPRPLPALAHLGEVRVGVVPQVEEAHEHLAMGLDGVRIQVGHCCDDRQHEPGGHRQVPLPRPASSSLSLNRGSRAYRFHRPSLSRSTVQSARRTSPRETLEAPATRSSKRMGTSRTEYPSRRARQTISIWNEYPCDTTASSPMCVTSSLV